MAPHPLPLLLLLAAAAVALPPPPQLLDRHAIRGAPFPSGAAANASQLIVDPTLPQAPGGAEPAACSLPLLSLRFRGPAAASAAANYTPPEGCAWTRASLEVSASAEGEASDRVGSVWLHGVEILRTSTPVPTAAGVRWTVLRDVTRYSATLLRDGVVAVAFEGAAAGNASDSGDFRVNATLHFHNGSRSGGRSTFLRERILHRKLNQHQPSGDPRLHDLYEKPADQIVPLSPSEGDDSQGLWYRIGDDSDALTAAVAVPRNTRRAVLEVFASAHADDEFWYSNPPDFYYELNNLPVTRGHGPIRQLSVAVDGLPVSRSVPFPAVYSGGVNPLFWTPVAPVGSFSLPSRDVELTPVLGQLIDDAPHEITIGITSALPFWLVGANLHLWLDPNATAVTAGVIRHRSPGFGVSSKSESASSKWVFETATGGSLALSGWVASSLGNLTTSVVEEFEASGSITIVDGGVGEEAKFKAETKREVAVADGWSVLAKMTQKTKLPVEVEVNALAEGGGSGNYRSDVSVSRKMEETVTVQYGRVKRVSEISNSDDGEGWLEVGEGGAAVAGAAKVKHKYKSSGGTLGCYKRKMNVKDGAVTADQVINICSSDA